MTSNDHCFLELLSLVSEKPILAECNGNEHRIESRGMCRSSELSSKSRGGHCKSQVP